MTLAQDPKPGGAQETESDGAAGRPLGAVFLKNLGFETIFGFRSGPDGSAQAAGFIWSLFRAKRSILDPIRTIFDDLGPNRHCGPDLDLQDQAGDGPLEWVRPIPKALERSWHASGPSFTDRWETKLGFH